MAEWLSSGKAFHLDLNILGDAFFETSCTSCTSQRLNMCVAKAGGKPTREGKVIALLQMKALALLMFSPSTTPVASSFV